MRPSKAGPTGTRTTSPVPRTRCPASIPSVSSSRTHPRTSRSSVRAKPTWPCSKRTSSSSRTSARPDTSAMPSATASTRPTCSATGASVVALTRAFASLSQLSRSAGVFVTVQLLANSIEIRPPVVAHDRVAAVQLDAGDQGRIGAKLEWQFRTECRFERIADVRWPPPRKAAPRSRPRWRDLPPPPTEARSCLG